MFAVLVMVLGGWIGRYREKRKRSRMNHKKRDKNEEAECTTRSGMGILVIYVTLSPPIGDVY